jgi:hypothetical protein
MGGWIVEEEAHLGIVRSLRELIDKGDRRRVDEGRRGAEIGQQDPQLDVELPALRNVT